MGTGFRGTFVISWTQTEVDGLASAPILSLAVGATWSWRGQAVRVDGPASVVNLDMAEDDRNMRRRAARMVHKLVGAAQSGAHNLEDVELEDRIADSTFVLTNGTDSFTATVIDVQGSRRPLLMFLDDLPPQGMDLWVVHHNLAPTTGQEVGAAPGGMICFTPGTWLDTPNGPCRVEDLREGDGIQTKDNGVQPVEWVGSRKMTGARLFAMPHLRPIRIRAGAFGLDRPEMEFLVSPDHRLLISGAVSQSLFNTNEVLVSARDLVDGETVTVDLQVREVTYVHLLLPQHNVLWANGVETESFHPASVGLSALAQADRQRLLERNRMLEHDPFSYGGFARRNLTPSEAAILMHEAA